MKFSVHVMIILTSFTDVSAGKYTRRNVESCKVQELEETQCSFVVGREFDGHAQNLTKNSLAGHHIHWIYSNYSEKHVDASPDGMRRHCMKVTKMIVLISGVRLMQIILMKRF